MTEGYDYYDIEVLLNGIPAGGLSQYHYQGSTGFGLKPEDCYFKIPIPLQVKEKETVTMLPMEEIMKSVEQYVKEGKILIKACLILWEESWNRMKTAQPPHTGN